MAQNRESISKLLNDAHQRIYSQLKLKETADKDRIIAQQIQLFLQALKGKQDIVATNPIDELLISQAQELLAPSLQILNAGRTSVTQGTKIFQTLFGHRHGRFNKEGTLLSGTATSFGGDDIFEEEFAAVLAAIEGASTGSSSSVTSFLVGNETANVNLDKTVLSPIIQDMMSQYANRLGRRISETKENPYYSGPTAKSQKVDVKGFSMNIYATVNPEWDTLFSLFQGRTFSLKNYASYTKQEHANIQLGNTDYFKAIYGTLSEVGYSQNAIEEIFYHGIGSLLSGKSSNKGIVSTHFYHMRLIYELIGVGLYVDGEKLDGVDFLIYNDPDTKNIYVRSTADILYELLESQNKLGRMSAFGAIQLEKYRFK